MSRHGRRYAPFTTQVRGQLNTFSERDSKAFKAWLDEFIKDSKQESLNDDIPSSQIPPKESHISASRAQLFAVIDTCSLVRFRSAFMKFVTDLRRSYRDQECPVKFIIPIVVLEELDKCNRPVKRQQRPNQQQTVIKQEPSSVETTQDDRREVPIVDLLQQDAPPRAFMRFIDTEMRAAFILGELDPYKTQRLPQMEIINHDDRILESSIRAKMFVESRPHHKDTRVVLVTEDNNFKSKATTFQVASFRWREFEAKYHNFGRKHCVSTPPTGKTLDSATATTDLDEASKAFAELLARQPLSDLKPNLTWMPMEAVKPSGSDGELDKVTSTQTREVTLASRVEPADEAKKNRRSTSMKIRAQRGTFGLTVSEDIKIIREIISLK